MDPSSPDVKRPSRNLISTPGPNPIQSQSLYMTKDSACPLSSLMAYMRSTGQEAGKINVHKTKRSITERESERERESEWVREEDNDGREERKKNGRRTARKPKCITGLIKESVLLVYKKHHQRLNSWVVALVWERQYTPSYASICSGEQQILITPLLMELVSL